MLTVPSSQTHCHPFLFPRELYLFLLGIDDAYTRAIRSRNGIRGDESESDFRWSLVSSNLTVSQNGAANAERARQADRKLRVRTAMSELLANYHLEILVYKAPDRSARASKHRD